MSEIVQPLEFARDGFKIGAQQNVEALADAQCDELSRQVLSDLLLTCSAHAVAELEKRQVNPGELRVSVSVSWPAP